MSEELSNLQFEALSRRIGDVVSCKVWQVGEAVVYTGVLDGVYPFDYISVDSQVIPFVGNTQAIEEVTLAGKDKVVYTNPQVKGYKGCSSLSVMQLVNAQREFLGRSVIMDGMAKRDDEKRMHR